MYILYSFKYTLIKHSPDTIKYSNNYKNQYEHLHLRVDIICKGPLYIHTYVQYMIIMMDLTVVMHVRALYVTQNLTIIHPNCLHTIRAERLL